MDYWEKELKPGTTLCFTGTYIGKEAQLSGANLPDPVLMLGNKNSVRWFPLLTFNSASSGEKILSSPELRKKLILNLEHYLEKHPSFSGIHLDFEGLSPEYSEAYRSFLFELKPSLKVKGKLLTLAVFPALEFDPKLAGFHSAIYKENVADEIVLMAYDLHSHKTTPGPVTNFSWAKVNTELLLKIYNPEQIWLGLPLYGYYWENGKKKPKLLTLSSDKKLVSEFGKETNGIHILRTEKGEGSLILKFDPWIEYAKNLKLAGLAFWRLGF